MHKYHTRPQLDQIIQDRFNASFMSDSKWDRLLEKLTDAFPDGVRVRFKLIHSDAIGELHFLYPDHKPWFGEPTLYKEVEWIEFPSEYEDLANPNNRKQGTTTYYQDIVSIAKEIGNIGLFQTEMSENRLRLFAYL